MVTENKTDHHCDVYANAVGLINFQFQMLLKLSKRCLNCRKVTFIN